jgi:hypothetical protein
MSDEPAALRRWHAMVASKDPALLGDLLADDAVFRSPAVFAPWRVEAWSGPAGGLADYAGRLIRRQARGVDGQAADV